MTRPLSPPHLSSRANKKSKKIAASLNLIICCCVLLCIYKCAPEWEYTILPLLLMWKVSILNGQEVLYNLYTHLTLCMYIHMDKSYWARSINKFNLTNKRSREQGLNPTVTKNRIIKLKRLIKIVFNFSQCKYWKKAMATNLWFGSGYSDWIHILSRYQDPELRPQLLSSYIFRKK